MNVRKHASPPPFRPLEPGGPGTHDAAGAFSPTDNAFGIATRDSRWHNLFDGIGDALLLLTPEGMLLDINPAATALLGYGRAEVIGRDVSMLYPSSEAGRVAACFDEMAQGKIAHYLDGVALARDGDRIPVDVVGSTIDNGDRPAIIAVVRDIRARKRTESELHVAQARFYLLAEQIREIFWICDPATHALLYVSPAFVELSKLSGCAAGDEAECWKQAIVPPDRPRFDTFLAAQARREAAEVEVRIGCRDGTLRWLHVRTFPWNGDGGQPLMAGVAEDITERRQSEALKLAHAHKQREMLVREAHHRMKNSLQGVVGLLRRCAGEHPALASALTGAISQVRSIAVIHELQSNASGRPVLLCELVPMIASSIEGLFDAGMKIRVSNHLDCPVALADSETVPLAIVLNELLMNAAKHGSENENERTVDVELQGNAERALILISNRGALPPIFDFAGHRGLGQGLELLAALLPEEHAELEFSQQGNSVVVSLALLPRAITAHNAPTENQGHV